MSGKDFSDSASPASATAQPAQIPLSEFQWVGTASGSVSGTPNIAIGEELALCGT